MLTLYGSPHCPHCRDCKGNFDANGIEYEYIDITGSMKALKQFLKLRDTLPLYDEVRAEGRVGIPTLVLEDGTLTFDWRSILTEKGLPVADMREVYPSRPGQTPAAPATGQACSLDGKNC